EAAPNNLPTQLTSFIGRDDQVREATQLLARSRLLTLTGPGGTGKTRLSLEIAAGVLDEFADGVYFVPLSAVHDPELVASAVAVKPDFQATNENAPAIAGICERVDGLPLAIELAAARIKLFSPPALLGRLEKSLNALGGGTRDAPARQQTLRGAILWSYDMLDDGSRRLLARFSVFARGGSLAQADPVCGPPGDVGGDTVDRLDQLAEQSLLRRLPDFDEPRFLMLQTIRDFAIERLEESGESHTIRDRHVEAFIALAQAAQPHLFGPQRREWLDRLEIDHDNVRAALDWSLESSNARQALRLAGVFWRFWEMRGTI